jgi:clorobiocin biosynthesis protein CloN6
MAAANARTSITLSPESHDLRIATLAGRGVYTMEEMEAWIEKALDLGIFQIDIWFFIGMQEQTEESVYETVDYCDRLLRRFRDRNVSPLICPMIPFLDPGSTFFERPDEFGYRIHHRTVEEHRRGMENASLINRINYSTRWLSRRDLVTVGYEAVRRLFERKAEHGALPGGLARSICRKIDGSLAFLLAVDEADSIADPPARRRAMASLAGEIRRRNDEMFNGTVANQAFPVDRQIGGRWFDAIPDFVHALARRAAARA